MTEITGKTVRGIICMLAVLSFIMLFGTAASFAEEYSESGEGTDDPDFQQGAQEQPVTEKYQLTSVQLRCGVYKYTGKPAKPAVEVRTEAGLVPDDGYSIVYSDNRNIGVGTVIVSGIGNYAGTLVKNFWIIPDTPKIKARTSKKIEGTQLIVSVKKKCKPMYYELVLCRSKNCQKFIAKARFRKKDLIKGKIYAYRRLKKGKTYYVRVRVRVSSKYISCWSKPVKIKGRG